MKNILFIISLFLCQFSHGESFRELAKKLRNHDLLKMKRHEIDASQELAKQVGSWKDPKFTVSAVNIPTESLSLSESMMTGIQMGLSQKFSLSGKYKKLKNAKLQKIKNLKSQTNQLERSLLKDLWKLSIQKERLINELHVLEENLEWMSHHLKISKRLYSTGKVPQQAVLDIEIRKSELISKIEQNKLSQKSIKYQLSILLTSNELLDIDMESIPWEKLNSWRDGNDEYDYQKISLRHALSESHLKLSALKRNLFPDITVGLTYTKRNQLDGLGNFVGASLSIPIPISDFRYAAKKEALNNKLKTETLYRSYMRTKPHILQTIEYEITNYDQQLNILKSGTLPFAKSFRDVTAKSYSRGEADYLELLRAEFQYQKQLIRQINLIAKLKEQKLLYIHLNGGDL